MAIADDHFHVCGEVGIERGSLTRFLFMRLGKGDALADRATGRAGCLDNRDGIMVLLDDDFNALADLFEDTVQVAREFSFSDADGGH